MFDLVIYCNEVRKGDPPLVARIVEWVMAQPTRTHSLLYDFNLNMYCTHNESDRTCCTLKQDVNTSKYASFHLLCTPIWSYWINNIVLKIQWSRKNYSYLSKHFIRMTSAWLSKRSQSEILTTQPSRLHLLMTTLHAIVSTNYYDQ